MSAAGLYRPPQWVAPPMVSVAITQQNSAASSGGTAPQTTTYVFDAVLDIEHSQRLEKTSHPVQTGADISSHAYLVPATCVLYVGMSDAMDAYSNGPANISPWTGNPSKSVSAYQTLLTLQAQRQPMTVTTRLRTYTNMVITDISPKEDYRTIAGLRCRVEFGQIRTATVNVTPASARANDTQTTGLGQVNPQPVPAATENQFNINNYGGVTPIDQVNIPGAGDFSSVNTNSLQTQVP